MDVPVSISLDNKAYSLATAIIFTPPGNEKGIGHYTAAVRFNNNFEVFDDLKPKTYKLNDTTPVCMQSLLYVLPK